MRKKKIVIVGGGGHAKVVIDAIRRSGEFDICGIIDNNLKPGDSVLGIEVIGGNDMLAAVFKEGTRNAFLGVGSIGNCEIRKRIASGLTRIGFKFPAIIHPKAVVADDVEVGAGTFVAAGAVVNPGARIGRNVIINTSASVDHDCVIGDFVHIAPGAVLSGGVKVGEETHIGIGANVIQYVNIAKRSFIKAGALVRDDKR